MGETAGDLLTGAAGPLTAEEAAAFAHMQFGIDGDIRKLTSERDQNFHLTARDGRAFVLKIAHPAEDPAVCDFQTRALQHIAAMDPDLPVPRAILDRAGAFQAMLARPGEAPRIVRLLSFLPGTMLHQALPTPRLWRSLGSTHARLGLALTGFTHPAETHDLLWDIKQVGKLDHLLEHIPSPRRALPQRALATFAATVAPVLGGLRWQVIHNDLNAHNVVVEAADPETVSGILDFGDMVRSPRICDAAVAASYLVSQGDGPLGGVTDYLAAYHAVAPLDDSEIAVLFDMIMARLAMTVLITTWRAGLFPDNAPYILRNNPSAWAGLERLAPLSRAEGRALLHDAAQARA